MNKTTTLTPGFIKTLHVRIKDKHAKVLDGMAKEVNFVWNYINELSCTHTVRTGKFFSGYDIQKYTAGSTKEGLTLLASTIDMIATEYATKRRIAKKLKLRWRVSGGAKKSLGWLPFKQEAIRYKNGQLRYAGKFFGIWDSYDLSKYELRSGNFSQDSRGRWYANICVKAKKVQSAATTSIGIDLGLKDFAALSDGTKIESQNVYRKAKNDLAVAQRANKARQVKAIHEKIKNRRKDFLHKLSTNLVRQHGAIFVGNVNASGLAKTNMAKSVLDAGWSSFRAMLRYKCDHAGVLFEEVNEAYSTVTCSACGSRSGPSGLKDLRIRGWSCSDCGAVHDRDTNAAINILARGHASLAEGVLV